MNEMIAFSHSVSQRINLQSISLFPHLVDNIIQLLPRLSISPLDILVEVPRQGLLVIVRMFGRRNLKHSIQFLESPSFRLGQAEIAEHPGQHVAVAKLIPTSRI